MIIYLNWSSSAGKTTIIKQIQELTNKPLIHRSVDHFWDLLDEKFCAEWKLAHLGYKFIQKQDENGYIVKIEKWEIWKKIDKLMIETIYNSAKNWFDVIVDDVLEYDYEINFVKKTLSDFNPVFVKVSCPLEIIKQREIDRGDRYRWLARGTIENIDKMNFKYDLIIDSSKSLLKNAKKIMEFVGLC